MFPYTCRFLTSQHFFSTNFLCAHLQFWVFIYRFVYKCIIFPYNLHMSVQNVFIYSRTHLVNTHTDWNTIIQFSTYIWKCDCNKNPLSCISVLIVACLLTTEHFYCLQLKAQPPSTLCSFLTLALQCEQTLFHLMM